MPRQRFHLTDAQWARVEPLLAVRKAGRPRCNDRLMVSGIVLAMRTGCPWRELPAVYGIPNTLMSRYNRWKKDGTIDKIAAALRFKPMPDSERHYLQGYGTIQRQGFKARGFNPWLRTEFTETAPGQDENLLEKLAELSGWNNR
jgi:transposase